MRTWVKLFTEINHDPKIGSLSWTHRGIWDALLALAGELDDEDETGLTGMLDTLDNTAWRIRCSIEELRPAIEEFTRRGMIQEQENLLFVVNFGKRQQRAPSSSPALVSDRVRRHRAAMKRACNEDVTRMKHGVTPSDSDSDSDSVPDSDTEIAATSSPAPAKPPKPVRAPRSEAVEVYHDVANIWPSKTATAEIDKRVTPETVPKWREVVQAWILRGFKPMNVSGMLDWYRNGIPEQGGSNGNKNRGPGRAQSGARKPAFDEPTPEQRERYAALIREAKVRNAESGAE